ncbi:MAG: DUF4249 family protein [Paludibacter sp.]|nr:DUF4249 family protein [Paludibacter sp.]
MAFYHKIIVIIILLVATACTDLNIVQVDISENFNPDITVNSLMQPDSNIIIIVSPTQAAFSNKTEVKPQISSASLVDILNNQTYSLEIYTWDNYIVLKNQDFCPIPGGEYCIKIQTTQPAKTLIAKDKVPERSANILNLNINPVKGSTAYLGKINFTSIGTDIYYELLIYSQEVVNDTTQTIPFYQTSLSTTNPLITREDYYPSLIVLSQESPKSLLFHIDNPKDTVCIDFEYDNGGIYTNGKTGTCNHNLRIELRTVSESFFLYKTSLYKQMYAAAGDLLYGIAEPVKVVSNIEGGVGLFGSYIKTDTTVFVAGRNDIIYE